MEERKILMALMARKLETAISSFVSEHSSEITKLGMKPEQVRELLWELTDEAVALRQKHVSES